MLKDKQDKDILQEEIEGQPVNPLVAFIKSKLEEADRSRSTKQNQWLDNVKAMRGEDPGTGLRPDSELKSIYVRTTSTKTKAAFSQISEALLGNDNFPISIEPTTRPDGIAEFAHIKQDQAETQGALNPLDVGNT